VSIVRVGVTARSVTAAAAALSVGSVGTSVRIDRITASYIASARSRSRCCGGVESKVSTAA
jgi:hypothetical protein